MAFDKVAYDNEYRRQNYDRIAVQIPKGRKDALKAYADRHGETLNSLFVKAVEQYTSLDLSKA